jgi:hypothetical protein
MVVTGDMRGVVENNGVFIVAMPAPPILAKPFYSAYTMVILCQNSACNVQNSVLYYAHTNKLTGA